MSVKNRLDWSILLAQISCLHAVADGN